VSFNILVVDDSVTVFEVLQKTIRLAQIPTRHLHHATNGKMALKILEEEWIDLVFADLHMPEMGGVELINTMKERNLLPSIPVIVVSAEGNRQVIEQLLGLGARAFIRKPFSPEEIQAVITGILGACHA
jgi:two-component system, chemotaxis family, chemotaxis protein CheY